MVLGFNLWWTRFWNILEWLAIAFWVVLKMHFIYLIVFIALLLHKPYCYKVMFENSFQPLFAYTQCDEQSAPMRNIQVI